MITFKLELNFFQKVRGMTLTLDDVRQIRSGAKSLFHRATLFLFQGCLDLMGLPSPTLLKGKQLFCQIHNPSQAGTTRYQRRSGRPGRHGWRSSSTWKRSSFRAQSCRQVTEVSHPWSPSLMPACRHTVPRSTFCGRSRGALRPPAFSSPKYASQCSRHHNSKRRALRRCYHGSAAAPRRPPPRYPNK